MRISCRNTKHASNDDRFVGINEGRGIGKKTKQTASTIATAATAALTACLICDFDLVLILLVVVDDFGILEIDRVPMWRDSKNNNKARKKKDSTFL